MTLELLRNEIWRHTGEQSDINPVTDTQYNSGPLLTWVVNEAQRQIASWKNPKNDRIFRIRSLINELYFKSFYLTNTLDQDSSSLTIVLPSTDVGGQNDRYNGWIVRVNGESRLIVDYDGATYTGTVNEAWTTSPITGDTYELYKRFSLMLPSTHTWVGDHIQLPAESDRHLADGNLTEPLKIIDLARQDELDKAKNSEAFEDEMFSASDDAGKWYRKGNRLYFQHPVNEERWYKMEYYRMPTDLSAATDEPEIPSFLHYGIVLWGIIWGFSRQQESASKWSAQQDFNNFMESRISTFDVEFERSEDYGELQMR